ncbi:hypothetical protein AAEX28_08285 [Lentisphaerota bacterium WC36G]|nr:hypothetical protein LJT99_11140 [Lentisphaerae bacterium WC36]
MHNGNSCYIISYVSYEFYVILMGGILNNVEQNASLNIVTNRSSIVSEVNIELIFEKNMEQHDFFECAAPIPPNAIIKNLNIFRNGQIINEIELCDNFTDNLNTEQNFHCAVVFQDNVSLKFAFWNLEKDDTIRLSFDLVRKHIFCDRQQNRCVFTEIGLIHSDSASRFSQVGKLDYISGSSIISYQYNPLYEVTPANYVKVLDSTFFYKKSKKILNLLSGKTNPLVLNFKCITKQFYDHFAYFYRESSLLNLSFSSKINSCNYYFSSPKTLTIVIECSKVVMGFKFEQIKKAVITALKCLDENDSFCIAAIGCGIKKFRPTFCYATQNNIAEATNFIENLDEFDDSLISSLKNKQMSIENYIKKGCFINYEGEVLSFRNSCPAFFENKLTAIITKNFNTVRYYSFVELNKINCSLKELSSFSSGGHCEYIYSNSDLEELTIKQMTRIKQSNLKIEAVAINGINLFDNSWIAINSSSWRKRNILIDVNKIMNTHNDLELDVGKPLIVNIIYRAGEFKKIKETYKILPFVDNHKLQYTFDSESKFFKHLNLLFLLQRCKADFNDSVYADIMRLVDDKKLPRSLIAYNTTLLNNKDFFIFPENLNFAVTNDVDYLENIEYDDYNLNEEGYFRLLEEPEIYEVVG